MLINIRTVNNCMLFHSRYTTVSFTCIDIHYENVQDIR